MTRGVRVSLPGAVLLFLVGALLLMSLSACDEAVVRDPRKGPATRAPSLTLHVRADAETVVEGAAARFTVTVTGGPSTAPVEVGYEVAGTAQPGTDYTPPSGRVTLAAGVGTATIAIPTLEDDLDEDHETVSVSLSGIGLPNGVALGTVTATATVVDDDPEPVLAIADGSAKEDAESVRLAVTLAPASGRWVTVRYATADGTAEAGKDYAAAAHGMLTFSPGDLAHTIAVPILPDDLEEADRETFTVMLTEPEHATLGDATATATILDDDENPNPPPAATAIAPGTTISGRLETAADVDYFKVTVDSTGTLVVATDVGKARDPQHHDYRDTVVRIEGAGPRSSTAGHYDELNPAAPGTYYLRVTSDFATRYDLAVWLIDATAPDLSFDIELRFLGTNPTATQEAVIRDAARAWQRVITRGLPDKPVTSSEQYCEAHDRSLFGAFIDDLLVNIRLEAIDGAGGTLAVAGPCLMRFESGLPYLGDVLFDTADLVSMERNGILRGTAMHEIAHVLGFGLLWHGRLQEPSSAGSRVLPGRDTHFSGPEAIAAFDDAGGARYAGAKVPVENDTDRYGVGALDYHWREAVFGAELMTTAVVVADGPEPLSSVTIASLEDLGYQVDYTEAERYALPAAGAAQQARGAVRLFHLGNDVRRGPIRVDARPERPTPVIAR